MTIFGLAHTGTSNLTNSQRPKGKDNAYHVIVCHGLAQIIVNGEIRSLR